MEQGLSYTAKIWTNVWKSLPTAQHTYAITSFVLELPGVLLRNLKKVSQKASYFLLINQIKVATCRVGVIKVE